MKVKLNIGCGDDIRSGWENYDKYPLNNSVKYLNLNDLPLNLPDNHADFILISLTFELLTCDKLFLMKEIRRILKDGGRVKIVIASFSSAVSRSITYFEDSYFDVLFRNTTPNKEFHKKIFSGVFQKEKETCQEHTT